MLTAHEAAACMPFGLNNATLAKPAVPGGPLLDRGRTGALKMGHML